MRSWIQQGLDASRSCGSFETPPLDVQAFSSAEQQTIQEGISSWARSLEQIDTVSFARRYVDEEELGWRDLGIAAIVRVRRASQKPLHGHAARSSIGA